MSDEPAEIYLSVRHRRRSRVTRSPVLFAAAGLVIVASLAWIGQREDSSDRPVILVAGDSALARSNAERLRDMSPRRLRSWLARLPARRTERQGPATLTFELSPAAALAGVRIAARAGGGEVRLPERPVEAHARLPIVKQRYRNNCETAALSMLLTARDKRVGQAALQRRLPADGPLDPQRRGEGLPLWGDPRKGFVGRVQGGGTAGGYGVYEGPVRRLASRYGVELKSLSSVTPSGVYRRLLSGHPVMAWVGLSDGPYMTWRTPDGARITGNFGEHTVVLTGIDRDGLDLNDPLTGRRERWTRDHFETLWSRLGRRALSI